MIQSDMREAFLRGQQEQLASIRNTRKAWLESLAKDAIEWLLVVPSWTVELARACGFPSGLQDVGELLREMRDRGLCESRPAEDPEGELFWMPESVRAEQLERLGVVERRFRPAIVAAGRAIDAQARDGGRVPSAVRRWAALASKATSVKALEAALNGHLEILLPRPVPAAGTPWRETTDEALGEALRWVEAARRLEPFFGLEGVAAIAKAWRWLELIHLRATDMQHLHDFVAREEQLRAFDRLLEGEDGCWALHYIGQAGVGKTMLARHIVTRLVPERGGCAARIDFDRLAPDYPSRAPWLLVERLAEQLRLQDRTGLGNRLFKELDNNILRLRERVIRKDWSIEVSDAVLTQQLAYPFAAALAQLPQPTVLVLDTCEELVRVGGWLSEKLRVTFLLLEQMHACHPGLRVVFCGRRGLASAGAGWWAKSSLPEFPPRPYLRLHEIRGFTHPEARTFFGLAFEHSGRTDAVQARALLPPILEQSREEGRLLKHGWVGGRSSRFIWADPSEAPRVDVERFNPYRLGLYVNWVLRSPQLTPEEIRAEKQVKYVQFRILERIGHEGLESLLPTLSLLGCFDRELLASTWKEGSEAEFEEAFEELLRQEWLDGDGQIYEVEPVLREELSRCLRQSREKAWIAAWNRVVEHLEAFTTSAPLEQLQTFHVHILVRLLLHPDRPRARDHSRRVLGWWQAMERRVAELGEFDRGRELCERLLAKHGPLAPEHSPERAMEPLEEELRTAVLATYAAALAQGWRNAESVWDEVWKLARGNRRLKFRATAGLLVATRFRKRPLRVEQIDELWELVDESYKPKGKPLQWDPSLRDEQQLASYVAAIEAVLERAEDTRQVRLAGTTRQFDQLRKLLDAAGASRELRAFALVLCGRNARLRGEPHMDGKMKEWFSEALKLVGPGPTPRRWLDWRSPEDLGARIRLEYIRAMYPVHASAREVLAHLGWKDRGSSATVFLPGASNIDQDRFNAALLMLAGRVEADVLEELDFLDPAPVDLPVECNAHRAFSPALVVLAELMAMQGQVEEAQDCFSAQARGSERRAMFELGAESADHASLRVARRMRNFGELSSTFYERLLRNPPAELPPERLLLMASIHGQMRPDYVERLFGTGQLRPPKGEAGVRWRHACWRSAPVLDETSAELLLEWASKQLLAPLGSLERLDFWACCCLLDAVEAGLLAERWSRTRDFREPDRLLSLVDTWCQDRPGHPEELVRLGLRLWVLREEASAEEPLPEVLRWGVERLGGRRFAELAREEGELLALRLPRQGALLLALSRSQFLRVGDTVGAFIAGACEVLARNHFAPDSLPGMLEALSRDYGKMVEKGLPLPAWQRLQEAAARGAPHELIDTHLMHTGWKPWLLRLMLCMARSAALLEGNTQRLERLFQESSRRYGGYFPSGRLQMSTELEALWALARGGVERERRWGEGESPSSSTCLMVQRVLAEPTMPLEKGVLLGPALRVEVSLESSPRERVCTFDVDPRVSYEEVRRMLPRWLREVACSPAREGVTLRVTPEAAEPCWEYILGVEHGAEEGRQFPRFRRVVADGLRAGALREEPLQCAQPLCAGPLQLSLAQQAWASWGGCTRFPDASDSVQSNWCVDVVHLITSAVPTSRGVRLQLVGEEYYEQQSRSREELIAGSDLLRNYPNLRMVILQGVPLVSSQWLASERLQAGLLRWFAARLAQSGELTAVVVLPCLPLDISALVLKELTPRLNEQDWPGLLDGLMPELRSLVREHIPLMTPRERTEAAMDLCLYLPPELVRDGTEPLLQTGG
ncbi:MAG TPA: ATP-binding protein [Archangium sp.]|uniref:ATP-binding protein n=1 Tax=Archangium sp. TaxID=1872627 RepID=UPI002E363C1A|nr:ATP-binding protein [Archangium sp.]HEX5745998.1 ATP-binding protein [Archangium sp.]